MSNKIKLKRGLSSNISSVVLDDGEVALTTDTNKLYSKKGEIAPNNVYVGTSEPPNSNIECWINPDGQSSLESLNNRINALEQGSESLNNRINALEQDTGWQNISLVSGVSAKRARVKKRNGVVFLEILELKNWSLKDVCAIIPEGFRPDTVAEMPFRYAAATGGSNFARPEVNSNGEIIIYATTGTAGSWVDLVISYLGQ